MTLETQKRSFGENEAISNDLVGYAHIETFALKIFNMADNEDRSGQSSKKTAKNFLAAANYLEILRVFGEIDADVEGKIKYAKWRATEIVKAAREGRPPVPPPELDEPKTDPSLLAPDQSMEGFDPLSGAGSSAAFPGPSVTPGGYSPSTFSPAVAPPVLPTTPQPSIGITDFPSPPAGSMGHITMNTNTGGNVGQYMDNSFQGSIGSTDNTWNQPALDQGQNFYNPAASPPAVPPHPTSSTYITPGASSPAPPGSGGYMATTPNPTSPAPNFSNAQYGYGAPTNSYQPSPSPSNPVQPSYPQPGFSAPSAPYQQPQPPMPSQPQVSPAYTPIPVVLDPEVSTSVQKHCKFTISALTYDDIPTAIDNLEKALALLRPYNRK